LKCPYVACFKVPADIGKQQGQLNSPLTEIGITQAEALSEGLMGKEIEIIYSSDLGRALQTASIISQKLKLPVFKEKRLLERNLGILQGLTMEEFRHQYPQDCNVYQSDDLDYIIPGGESIRQCYERYIAGCNEIISKHKGQKVLIVAHSGIVSCLFCHTLQISFNQPRSFSLFNAAINVFSIKDDQWRLNTWGDISHLKRIQTLDDF